MAITVTVLFTTFWAYGKYGAGLTFFSDSEPKYANIAVRARGNLSVDEINELVQEVEQEILEIEGIKSLNSSTMLTGTPGRDGGMDRIGRMFLELHDENIRDKTGTEIFEEIREQTKDFAGVSVEIEKWSKAHRSANP